MKHTHGVLIVDDDPMAQSIYKSFFASVGVDKTYAAASGKQGMHVLNAKEQDIALIILDINMPEGEGIEFLRHLHTVDFTGHLVIGSTSYTVNGESAQKLATLYGLKLLGFIAKPLTKRKLEQVLNPSRIFATPVSAA